MITRKRGYRWTTEGFEGHLMALPPFSGVLVLHEPSDELLYNMVPWLWYFPLPTNSLGYH